jgi:putative Ca2+/H+ antiporter (TMEM165/GDT1 family)
MGARGTTNVALGAHPSSSSLQAALEASPLAAAIPAFSLVFLSELGDKTFFLAALLAARVGRRAAFAGSVGALALMSIISAGIGAACKRVPDAMASSLPLSRWLSAGCLVWFGVATLRSALATPPTDGDESDGELAAAQEELAEAEAAGRVAAGRLPRGSAVGLGVATAEVASLIFLAEWGDRSMLATIALAAAQGPVGVAAGAAAGHAVATALAVLGGSLVSGWLSEKVIGVTGGVLFLVFAAATWAGFM